MQPEINGTVRPPFDDVLKILRLHLESRRDVGFGLCVYLWGELVIDVWAGHADRAATKSWSSDSLVPLTSISKTLLTTVVLRLAERDVIDLDAPIAEYWPEFGANGKGDITVACAMSHQAGIPVFERPVTLADELAWTPIVERFQEMRPIWRPGSAHGYHAIVLGFLLWELLHRVTGRKASELAYDQLIMPLGLDVRMPLAGVDILRLVEVIPPVDDVAPSDLDPAHADYANGFVDPSTLLYRATFGSTAMTFEDMNNPAYYTTDRPTAYGTAAAVARMYAALISEVDGVRLLEPDSVAIARKLRAQGRDRVFAVPTRWGTGFMLPGGPLWPDVGRGAFGHIGSTGSLAFADPEVGLALAFLPNKMKSVYEIPDRRATALVAAIRECARASKAAQG